MDLDKRIIKGKKPLDCFDAKDAKRAKHFVGKKGFFGGFKSQFMDLDTCPMCVLDELKEFDDFDGESPFLTSCKHCYRFFLPEEWVKEPEKKYRPFTGSEFAEKFDCMLGKVIRLREKRPEYSLTEYEYKTVLTGYRWCGDIFEVFLNSNWINLSTLLETYEHYENSEWCKFGVEVEECD